MKWYHTYQFVQVLTQAKNSYLIKHCISITQAPPTKIMFIIVMNDVGSTKMVLYTQNLALDAFSAVFGIP